MSAIAAVFNLDGAPIERASVDAMLATMASRSPDGHTAWQQGNFALGHGLLINTPESSRELQPLPGLDGRVRIVWDGRLDNRGELRRQLALGGVVPRDDTDAELVLQLFICHRDRTPERLLGDFAFAVIDTLDQTVFFARDHVGCRPLHYVLTDRVLALASDDEALVPYLRNGARPNMDRVVAAMLPMVDDYDWEDGWIAGISTLMPGSCMTVGRNRKLRRRMYWRLGELDLRAFASQDEADESFRTIFREAVRDRQRAPHAPAMLLSGGIDSASIAAALMDDPGVVAVATTASSIVRAGDSTCFESQSIRRLTNVLGCRKRSIELPIADDEVMLSRLFQAHLMRPHPLLGSVTLIHALSALAASDGARVLLHGAAGDLVTHVPDTYVVDVAREQGLLAALRESRLALQHHTYLKGAPPHRLILQILWEKLLPSWCKTLRPKRKRLAQELVGAAGFTSEYTAAARLVDRVQAAWSRGDKRAAATSLEQHHVENLPPAHLWGFDAFDRVGALTGIEFRDVYADRRIIEWFTSCPMDCLVSGGRTKAVVRRYVTSRFGPAVGLRTDKTHLGAEFSAGIRRRIELAAPAMANWPPHWSPAVRAGSPFADLWAPPPYLSLWLSHIRSFDPPASK